MKLCDSFTKDIGYKLGQSFSESEIMDDIDMNTPLYKTYEDENDEIVERAYKADKENERSGIDS